MVMIEVKATVTKEGKLILSTPVDVPPEVAPGEHIVQLTINSSAEAEEKPLDIPFTSTPGRKIYPYAEKICTTIGAGERVFLDTNVLVYASIPASPFHLVAQQ